MNVDCIIQTVTYIVQSRFIIHATTSSLFVKVLTEQGPKNVVIFEFKFVLLGSMLTPRIA